MSRLPIVGSDDGTWGDILNDYLEVQHSNATGLEGTHKAITIPALSATTDDAFKAKLTSDTQYQFTINADGALEWGPGGTTAPDTNLYRSAANTLKTDDSLIVAGALVSITGGPLSVSYGGGKTTLALASTSTDTGLTLGGDTNLYRSAANTLTTDDSLVVTGTAVASNFKRGTGDPEGAVSGSVGDLFLRTDGASGTTLYVKESGSATATGWAPAGSGGASTGAYAETFGNASVTSYTITHNLGSKDVFVGVYQVADGAEVDCDIARDSDNTVELNFSVAPAANSLRVIVAGTYDAGSSGAGAVTFPINQDAASAGTDDLLRAKLTADTQYRYVVSTDGMLEWGPGGSTAPDTNLYRSAADTLKTDDAFMAAGLLTAANYQRGSGTPEASVTGSVGDIYQRTDGATGTSLYIKESGSGNTGWTAVASPSLINYARQDLANDFTAAQTISAAGGKTTLVLTNTGTDTGLTIGGDTNLYRAGANELATDDTFFAADVKGTLETATLSKAGLIGVATGQARYYVERSYTILEVRVSLGTAPTGASFIVDLNKNGSTVFTNQANRPTVAVSTNTIKVTNPDVTALASGDYLSVDVDQIGSTIAGSDLTVQVVMRRV